MDYQDWLEEVENITWIRLGAKLSEFDDVSFESLFESGYSPEDVVQHLYEDEEEDEKEYEAGEDY